MGKEMLKGNSRTRRKNVKERSLLHSSSPYTKTDIQRGEKKEDEKINSAKKEIIQNDRPNFNIFGTSNFSKETRENISEKETTQEGRNGKEKKKKHAKSSLTILSGHLSSLKNLISLNKGGEKAH